MLKREGGAHSLWTNLANGAVESVPRHVEIANVLAKKICRNSHAMSRQRRVTYTCFLRRRIALAICRAAVSGEAIQNRFPCAIKTIDLSQPESAMPLLRELIEELHDVAQRRRRRIGRP